MQLAPLVAQPSTAPPADAASPFLRMTSILRTAPLPAEDGTTAATAAGRGPLAPAQLASEPSLPSSLFASVVAKQSSYVANQQLLGAISAAFGARLSQVGAEAWALLRGTSGVDGQ